MLRGVEPTLLGQRAIALLRLLLDRAASPVSKDALIEAAWPGLAVEDSNLTVQIAALRRVLDQDGGAAWIETLPRRGYRYIGPSVTRTPTTVPAKRNKHRRSRFPKSRRLRSVLSSTPAMPPGSPMAWPPTSSRACRASTGCS